MVVVCIGVGHFFSYFSTKFSSDWVSNCDNPVTTHMTMHQPIRNDAYSTASWMGFSDYAKAMSVLQRGTEDEKVDWLFRVFDVDGDGEIHPREMREIFEALEHLVRSAKDRSRRPSRALSPGRSPTPSPYTSWLSSHHLNTPEDEERAREDAIATRTNAVFADMDLNRDGRIDRHEFRQMIKRDEHVHEFLHLR